MAPAGGGGGGSSPLSWSLLAFAVLPPLVYLASEVDKSIRFGALRGVEVADIAVAFPVWAAVICNVHWRVLQSSRGGASTAAYDAADAAFAAGRRRRRRGRGLFVGAGVFLLCVFAYGHAMHWTANAINTYMTEYNLEKGLRARVDDEVYELIYWFDEHLGHAIFFTTLHAFVAVWTLASAYWTTTNAATAATTTPPPPTTTTTAAAAPAGKSAHKSAKGDGRDQGSAPLQWPSRLVGLLLPVAAGGACGVVHSVAFIEGSSLDLGRALASAHLAVVVSALLAAAAAALPMPPPPRPPPPHSQGVVSTQRPPRRFGAGALELLARSEVLRFTATLGATVLGATAVYGRLFPAGETPSQLGGWWCVVVPSQFEYCMTAPAAA
jgi:hypothetical protein